MLELYREMESYGVSHYPVTLAGILSSCAYLGAQGVSKEIEKRITRASHISDGNGGDS